MRHDADLSPQGIGRLQAEFLDALDLHEVTLIGNDSGLFQFVAGQYSERLARLVITSCEAFENFPPGLPGRVLTWAAYAPGGLNALAQPLRWPLLRRLPIAFGWMSKRPISSAITDAWLYPLLHQAAIRRDLIKYLRLAHKNDMQIAAEQLRTFDRPVLILWAKEDRPCAWAAICPDSAPFTARRNSGQLYATPRRSA
jgi:pimeloyl-ACP methyl ester carboxylesterase